jgi:hypothetical protein
LFACALFVRRFTQEMHHVVMGVRSIPRPQTPQTQARARFKRDLTARRRPQTPVLGHCPRSTARKNIEQGAWFFQQRKAV